MKTQTSLSANLKSIKNLTLLVLTIFLSSCDSEIDTDLDTIITPCENEHFFGLNTLDPWSGSTPLSKNLDFGTQDVIAPEIGGPITYSNASTYNYDIESYHFFNTTNKTFVNVNTLPPATLIPLTGEVDTSTYSHLVYVSMPSRYYIIEITDENDVNLVEVNVNTGDILDVIDTGFNVGAIGLQSISITTNNVDKVFTVINRFLITTDLGTDLSTIVEIEEAFSTNNFFYGAEYNVTENRINALRLEVSSDVINLVNIDLTGSFATSFSLADDINNFTPIASHFYSTTLSCDESLYRLTYISGNNNTIYHEINMSSGEILTDTIEADYYFGIESNANN